MSALGSALVDVLMSLNLSMDLSDSDESTNVENSDCAAQYDSLDYFQSWCEVRRFNTKAC